MIKAIETEYKGYRFRSRLEARWAVFFDELKIKWEYESEGYDIGGIRYLPDFKIVLPESVVFVEIKPNREPDENEIKKAMALSESSIVMILCGDPIEALWNADFSRIYSRGKEKLIYKPFFTATALCIVGANPISDIDWIEHIINILNETYKKFRDKPEYLDAASKSTAAMVGVINSHLVAPQRAALKARSSRFEYGACPPK